VTARLARRSLLVGSLLAPLPAAAVLVDRGILPGQGRLHRALGGCDLPAPPPAPAAGPVVRGVFDSVRRRRTVSFVIRYPQSTSPGDRLPVCLALHGYGGTALDVSPPGASFAVAAMDGGPGYWHPHEADDPLGALLDEFLPLLAARGLDVGRAAVAGWSMGGYGALLCGLSRPGRFAAVVASSPAIWRSYEEARRVNAGAFDSAAEWARYDVLARAGELRGVRLRVDCGVDDPFAPAVRELRRRLPDPGVVHLSKGCHDGAFWGHAPPAQVRFIEEALVSAKRT